MWWEFNCRCIWHNYKFIILLLIPLLAQSSLQDSLKSVQIAFRHGDRNPMSTYPTDPYKDDSYWPEGWGALTREGKVKIYNLGKFIKQRYADASIQNIAIFSSETNRSITSGMAVIAGFKGEEVTVLDHLEATSPSNYRIRVIPKEKDKTIMVSQECPKYLHLFQDFFKNSNVIKRFYREEAETFEVINKHSGLSFKYLTMEMIQLVDTLLIEKSRNLELPDWAEHLYFSGALHRIRDSLYPFLAYTKEMKMFQGGYLMKTLIDEMDNLVDNLYHTESESKLTSVTYSSMPKMSIHSGHDITVGNWLILLGVYDIGNYGIPYGAAVFLELHEGEESFPNYYVKVYYKNNTEADPFFLEIPRCPHPCRFEHFKILMEHLLVENREEKCKLDGTANSGCADFALVDSAVYLLTGWVFGYFLI